MTVGANVARVSEAVVGVRIVFIVTVGAKVARVREAVVGVTDVPSAAGLKGNCAATESAVPPTFVGEYAPVAPAGVLVIDDTLKLDVPLTDKLLTSVLQGAPGSVAELSPPILTQAKTNALSVAVVTLAADEALVCPTHLEAKVTSSGVVRSTPLREPIQ